MAQINKSVLGKVSGALGDITFRQMNGKSIVAIRPRSFMPGTDADAVARRARFAISVKLAKSINSVPELKEIWSAKTPSGISAYNLIMKTNYQVIESPELPGLVSLAPGFGFIITNPVTTINPSELIVSMDQLGSSSGINTSAEVSFKLISLVYLFDEEDNEKNVFIGFNSEAVPLQLTSAVNFSIPVSNVESQLIAKYSWSKVFNILLTLNSDGETVHYSNTF